MRPDERNAASVEMRGRNTGENRHKSELPGQKLCDIMHLNS